ncbi:sugar ABC transporter permease [Mobilitalea sibirica]|uniref:Sugar ABC transporter permease n=1 Tax=Mobilitalea sibirica TaxID=1462919 RepID=A0A8J7HBT5_9FIRM|nr:sugar ABC transporter permease [Mobilitalea sibirica]MBH1939604.1 sugar ABC transporter permease [Mobilitalea sibirica]
MKENRKAWAFLAPSFLGVIFFVLIPFSDAIKRSFKEAMGGKFVGMDNYMNVLHNEAFRIAAQNTSRFIIICVPILLLLSLVLAVMINNLKKHRSFFKTSFLIPLAIPVSSVVFLWKVVFHQNGLLNGALSVIGLEGYDWMSTKAFPVLVFSYIWKNIGYDMVLWLAGLDGISQTMYEAAAVDGANAWKKFWYITLPGLLPTVFIVTVLSILNSFKVFREAYLIAGAYPRDNNIYMLQHLFNNWFTKLDIQKMSAAAVMLALIIVAIILILQRIDTKVDRKLDIE